MVARLAVFTTRALPSANALHPETTTIRACPGRCMRMGRQRRVRELLVVRSVDQSVGTHREPRVISAFGSFSVTWSLLSSLRGRLLLALLPSVFSATEEDRLRLTEVSESVPIDPDPDEPCWFARDGSFCWRSPMVREGRSGRGGYVAVNAQGYYNIG
jgi:hypothetical protein